MRPTTTTTTSSTERIGSARTGTASHRGRGARVAPAARTLRRTRPRRRCDPQRLDGTSAEVPPVRGDEAQEAGTSEGGTGDDPPRLADLEARDLRGHQPDPGEHDEQVGASANLTPERAVSAGSTAKLFEVVASSGDAPRHRPSGVAGSDGSDRAGRHRTRTRGLARRRQGDLTHCPREHRRSRSMVQPTSPQLLH